MIHALDIVYSLIENVSLINVIYDWAAYNFFACFVPVFLLKTSFFLVFYIRNEDNHAMRATKMLELLKMLIKFPTCLSNRLLYIYITQLYYCMVSQDNVFDSLVKMQL